MMWIPLTLQLALAFSGPKLTPTPTEHSDYWARTLKTSPLKMIRKNAARHLGKMGSQDVVPILIEALQDKEVMVRAEAARALGNVGDERAFSALSDLSGDPDREVRKAASDSTEKIKAYIQIQKEKEEKANNPSGY